ncbi:ABC transporter permease subunit [Halostella litorea]|uniref:ABC transporter permease subunit n=1 Tax=Halostella litorea TaxID=2528831 RepID=UPI00109217ED|nr:ABC transporter permease subunit [Halostella litorea]
MSVGVVARKDFEDALRSRMLWSLTGLLVLLVGIAYVAVWNWGHDTAAEEMVGLLALPLQVLVPISALIVGYMSVVGERRSGSIKLLLGLPPTRGDVVLGKLVGRSGVLAAAVLTAFAVAVALSLALFGALPLAALGGLLLATLLLGFAFVGIAVGVSAASASRGRAMAATVGTYIVFIGFWKLLTAGVYYLLNDSAPTLPIEGGYLLLERLNPMQAFAVVATELSGVDVFPVLFQYGVGIPSVASSDLSAAVAGDLPFYLEPWSAVAVLVAWFAVPMTVGYLRFRTADLG